MGRTIIREVGGMGKSRRGTQRVVPAVALVGVLLSSAVGLSGPASASAYTAACNGASEAPGAFADAGLAADCLKLYGVSLGKADGTFGENDSLLRSQVSSLLARLIQLAGATLSQRRSFPDVTPETVPNAQVRDEIELLAGSGVIAGRPDGTFGPTENLTVAQGATLVVRGLQLIHTQKPNAYDVHDQGSTGDNYNYAVSITLLNQGATDIHGTQYPSQPLDVTQRGLLADMLAVSIEGLVDRSVVTNRGTAPPSCSASMSDPTPAGGGSETALVDSTLPNSGVTIVAHYKTTNSTFTGQTNSSGHASITFSIGHPSHGYTVNVDVNVAGQATCSTSFTPQ
jgi:hypothetical protein